MIASLSALLVGCSTVDYDFSDVAPKAQPSTMRSSGGMRFADTDPHEWEGGAPWHYAVHGTDVAKYQADIDWKKVARNDISFAFIKATEGGDIVDDYFARNWRAAKAAGVPRGAYHFYYHCRHPPAGGEGAFGDAHLPERGGTPLWQAANHLYLDRLLR